MFSRLLILSLTCLATACSAPERISVSGSTTVLPAVSRAAEHFSAGYGQSVIVNAGGSGSGFNQLAQGQTDIGMMSRDITAEERAQFPNQSFTTVAIGRDAVVPVVSSEIYDAGVTTLSFAQIKDIYAGKVDNWAIYGGPDKAIYVIDKEVSRGTRQVFMKVVMGRSKAAAAGKDLVVGSNNEAQTALAQSDAAIGMLSLAWLNDDIKGLSIKALDGSIATPTRDNISNGSWPIIRDLNIVVREDISPDAQRFVDFLLSPDGQIYVAQSGYVKITQ